MQAKILIIDDEPDVEDLIRQKFRKKIASGEYQFQFAGNGVQALKLFDAANDFTLVFTDINMPGMDGLTLLGRINEINPGFKTVVVSAYGDMNNIRTAMNRGAFDFLTKPIDFTDFEATLQKGLKEYNKILEGVIAKQNLESVKREKEKVEQSEKFKQQFLANMSHEIRTPLNSIKGMTMLLLKEELAPVQKDNLEIIRKSADNLIVIINDILDLSKIEAGKLELENIDFSLPGVIQNVYDILKLKADEKKISFKTIIPADIPKALKGDPVRLEQILINLVNNAIKFTEKGSVIIETKLKELAAGFSTIEVSVKDTGIGISDAQKEKLFETFSQASTETYRKFGGTGLGLSISRHLVELMGGTLSVSSEPGKGSDFFFAVKLPIGNLSKVEKNNIVQDKIPAIKNISVLLFEDNLFNQIVARQTLHSSIEGLNLEIAENGLVGLEKLRHNDYDLVLMDIQMPELNGYETTQRIRAEFEGAKKNIPILAMTANAIKEETKKCLDSGMNDYITKPFEPADLLNKMNKLLTLNK